MGTLELELELELRKKKKRRESKGIRMGRSNMADLILDCLVLILVVLTSFVAVNGYVLIGTSLNLLSHFVCSTVKSLSQIKVFHMSS